MSVTTLPDNMLRLLCDGRTPLGPCANHYELRNEQQAMADANERLARWGWRTKMDGYVQLHFCKPCSNKMDVFTKTRNPHTEVGKGQTAHRINR